MKKVLAFLVVIALVLPVAVAAAPGIDLSGLSFDELIDLRAQIDAALWASDDWISVTVPIGVYRIGDEIPAGEWTISPTDGSWAMVAVATSLADNGIDIGYMGYTYEIITSPSNRTYESGDATSITWNFKNGLYIQIEDSSVVFTRPTGPSFSFTK